MLKCLSRCGFSPFFALTARVHIGLEMLLAATFLIFGDGSANARNIYCHPGSTFFQWDGLNWQVSGYYGPLSEVALGNNFGFWDVSCKRNGIELSTLLKEPCHFRKGTHVSIRTYKKMHWLVCETSKDMNIDECVVECGD